ncbi:hybrid sensor histidine kinase/response regulator [Aquitalea sp. LB_tupeE]|uniref:ATP-binding response regulator n=1 Tax=Aquitalea sp. LB_tupeE TaxID=2748078 RepID=UPI0015BAE455|nr:hybrid sensor histidine kinase/response regulator [Aquitalea sp. LB_tupeE]NWK79919.1 response regulator [Aquitalea sp. LB_tupeE]
MINTEQQDRQDKVRIEQIRLLLNNLGSSVLPGILVVLLVAYALQHQADPLRLSGWCVVVIVSKLVDFLDARRLLARAILPAELPQLRRRLVLLHAIDGAAWGSLMWVGLNPASPPSWILAIAVLSGVAGNSMSILSPVLPVFIGFITLELGMIALKSLQSDALALNALGLAAIMYLATLLMQARNSAQAAKGSIELRFENLELVDRLRLASAEALRAQQEAEQANIAKSKFLAAASHDLRQPIHAQGLFLEVLGKTALDAKQQSLLANIQSATNASAEMLHSLLDYSRVDAGVITPQLQAFALQPLLNKMERELAPLANTKGLFYRSRDSAELVLSDPSLIELILRNLISNAIRYTQRGGILVGCRRRGDALLLEIWDSGIGIALQQQQEIFDEFHQLGNPERDRKKGLGLGLAIVRGLTQLLQHPLHLQSRPGRGSVFRLVLPRVAASSPQPEHAPPAASVSQRLPKATVLLIEDDDIVRSSMVLLLQSWGCQCMEAESLETALPLLAQQQPDLLISDYRLREQKSGTDAIRAIRQALGCDLPALLLTGDTAPARLREASDSGLPLLHKPVAPALLYDSLNQLLSHPACTTPGGIQ